MTRWDAACCKGRAGGSGLCWCFFNWGGEPGGLQLSGGGVRSPLICSQEAAQPGHRSGADGVWPWRRGDSSSSCCFGAFFLLPGGRAGKDSQTPSGCIFPLFSESLPLISSTNNNL